MAEDYQFTEEDVANYAALPDEERRKAMKEPWVLHGLADAVNRSSSFSGLAMPEKANVFMELGLPLSKLPLQTMDPFIPPSGQLPQVQSPIVQQPAIIPPGVRQAQPPGVPEGYQRRGLPLLTSLEGTIPYNTAGTPEDTWYSKIIRGFTSASPTGPQVSPPGTQTDILSIENAAKVAGIILWTAGSRNPFTIGGKAAEGVSAAGTAFGQEAVKTGGRIAGQVLPKFLDPTAGFQIGNPVAIAQWLMTQPALARAINMSAYNVGRFGMLDVTRDLISDSIRTGKVSKEEAAAALGPTLYRELVLGVPVALALQATGPAKQFINATRSMGPTMTRAVSEGMGTAPLDAAKVLDDVLWPAKILVKTSGKDAAGQHVELSALAPEQMFRNATVDLKGAVAGDYVRFHGGDAAMVVNKTDGGAVVRDVLGGVGTKLGPERVIKYTDPKVTGIIAPRGPIPQGMEVIDTTAKIPETYIFDRYLPNGKAYVTAPDGRKLIKDPAKLTTEADSYTLGEYSTGMKTGRPMPPPEGRMTHQDYVVTEFKADGSMKFEKPYGEIGETIPYKAITNPLPDHPDKVDFNSFWYALEPTTVLTMMNTPETTQLAKETLDALSTHRSILNEFHKQARGWQDAVGRTNAKAAERLTRAFSGVPHPNDAALMSPAEKTVLADAIKFAQQHVYPVVNMERGLAGHPTIPTNYPLPYVLFPEIVFGSGSRYTTTGQPIHQIASALSPIGSDNLVRVAPIMMGGDSVMKLDIHANFWSWLDAAMRYAADGKAFQGIAQKSTELAKYLAKNPENANAAKYLEWHGQAMNGRTLNAYLSDVMSHHNTLNKWQEWLNKHPKIPHFGGEASSASLGDVPIQMPKYELQSIDLFESARSMKTMSYRATIGVSANNTRLNLTQILTHTLPNMPGSSSEEVGRNIGLLGAGAVRGTGYAGLALAQHLVRNVGWMSKMFSSKNLEYFRQNGVLGDFEEVFQPEIAKGTLSKLKGVMDAALFAGMRGSEIVNRIGSFDAVKNAYTDDIRRKGILAAMSEPDVEAAVSNLAKSITQISQFIYGKGAKSAIHERGIPATEKNKGYIPEGVQRLIGPAAEVASQYNTFAYKTLSTYAAEWGQFKRNNPNFIRSMTSTDSPELFKTYLKDLDEDNRNQFWRTIALRAVTGSVLATSFGLNNLFLQAFGVDFNVPHVGTTIGKVTKSMFDSLSDYGLAGIPLAPIEGAKTAAAELIPGITAGKRFYKGNTLEEKLFVTNKKRRPKSHDEWLINGFSAWAQERR